MFVGLGTVVNVATVLVGATVGLIIGHRMAERTRSLVTDALGLTTLVLGFFAAQSLLGPAVAAELGSGVALLVVLGALLPGALLGSWLRITERLEAAADAARRRFGRDEGEHFVEGIITPTLVFCVGPLTIMGSMSDGLGLGADQLLVKSVLDGFGAVAFAASLGVGVLFSAGVLGLFQGSLTLVAFLAGGFLSTVQIDVLNATGGIILLGLGIRLLGLKEIRVGDLLPALVLAPVVTWLVGLVV